MSRHDVLAKFTRGTVTQYYDTDAMADEIVRLRGLVREAFREGFAIGWDDPGNRDYWPESEVSKKLEDA